MGQGLVHFELFTRKQPNAPWALSTAGEDRETIIAEAEEMLTSGRACAIKVTKEVLDSEAGGFRSYTILTKGELTPQKKAKMVAQTDTPCTSPKDLYTVHARERIARVLEDWLKRNGATPFELLHSPELAERLDAAGTDLQHAIQKVAIPESQETGQTVHEIIRRWNSLLERSFNRIIQDGRKGTFPDLKPQTLAAVAESLSGHPEKAYVLSGSLVRAISRVRKSAEKLSLILPFVQAAAELGAHRDWVMSVLETPLLEIFQARSGLGELLGTDLDVGGSLCVLIRLAAGKECDLISNMDSKAAEVLLPLSGTLEGYRKLIAEGMLPGLTSSVSKRLILELKGPRRLRPGYPELEIETLRALAMVMTAMQAADHERDDIAEAFSERSRMLVSSDFVDSLMQVASDGTEEIDRLIWLCENVVGGANKRQASRWLISALSGLKFEREMRNAERSTAQRLSLLAQFQKRIGLAKLPEKETQQIHDKLGALGMMVASDVSLIALLMRAQLPAIQKLGMLLSFASGEGGPCGPLSELARLEVLKILKSPDTRKALSAAEPAQLARLKPMMATIGIAA